MIGKTNSGRVQGILNITCDNSCTVTVTQTGKPYSFTQTGKSMSFKLPSSGTWHISATFGGLTQTKDVTITPGQVLNVKVLDSFYLYNAGTYMTGFRSGWSAGEQSSYVGITTASGAVYSKSTGSVNLTGYKTVKAKITGDIGGVAYTSGEIAVEIVTADNTVLATKSVRWDAPAWGGSESYDTTWTFNVSSINRAVYFRLMVQTWAGGGETRHATIYLHRIQMLS